jgi:phage shock protein A
MGIFSRLSDIINSNINALLDKAEDPEKILRLMVQEMEDTLVELRTAAAKSIAERKERERYVVSLETEQADWSARAELAVNKGRDDLAKSALLHKRNLADHANVIQAEIKLLSDQLNQLSDDTGKLQAKLADVKQRQRTILMRHAHAENTLRARSQVANARLDDMMQRFDYAERRIDGLEAQAEAMEFGRQRSLAQQIAELEQEDRLDQELAALKAKLQPAAKNDESRAS